MNPRVGTDTAWPTIHTNRDGSWQVADEETVDDLLLSARRVSGSGRG